MRCSPGLSRQLAPPPLLQTEDVSDGVGEGRGGGLPASQAVEGSRTRSHTQGPEPSAGAVLVPSCQCASLGAPRATHVGTGQCEGPSARTAVWTHTCVPRWAVGEPRAPVIHWKNSSSRSALSCGPLTRQPPSFASLRTCPERAENLPRRGGVLPGWRAFSLVSNLGHSCFNRAPHTRSGHLHQGPCILCI